MAIAADLEGTLTTGETWKGLAAYLRRSGKARAFQRFLLTQLPGAVSSQLGFVPKRTFRNHWLEQLIQLFSGMSEEAFADIADWVVEYELWPKRRTDVLAALKTHQAAGERLILASATYQPVLESFARRLAADAIGSPLKIQQGRLSGYLELVNAHNTKAQRLHEALGQERLYAAYGDSEADIPMLMLSDNPVAVYPDKALRSTANTLNWTIHEHH